jgi:pyridoxine 5-phosphate synthase
VQIALQTKPEQVTLVPEKRQEITTEGGLDVIGNRQRVGEVVRQLQDAGIEISLFIDPEVDQIEASRELGVSAIELHTGCFADATSEAAQADELEKLKAAGEAAREAGLLLHMGHGLTYRNVIPVAQIEGTCELNIGHSIIARAVLVGLERAVREMKELVN